MTPSFFGIPWTRGLQIVGRLPPFSLNVWATRAIAQTCHGEKVGAVLFSPEARNQLRRLHTICDIPHAKKKY